MLTGLEAAATYTGAVLPATLVFGAGVRLTFSSAMSQATAGVDARDAGVASAMVSTGQQVGGSIGTALLSTLAESAATDYVTTHAGPGLGRAQNNTPPARNQEIEPPDGRSAGGFVGLFVDHPGRCPRSRLGTSWFTDPGRARASLDPHGDR